MILLFFPPLVGLQYRHARSRPKVCYTTHADFFVLLLSSCCICKRRLSHGRSAESRLVSIHRGHLITSTQPSIIHTPHSFCISVPCLLGKKKKILKKERYYSSANKLHSRHLLLSEIGRLRLHSVSVCKSHFASGYFLGSNPAASVAACRMVLSVLSQGRKHLMESCNF